MAILEIKDISYSYDKKTNVLSDVTAELEIGKLYAILGPSGSGKTTLLSLLGGLDVPMKGKILFDGENIAKQGLANHRRNHVALIFQNYNLIDYMTPVENVKLTAQQDVVPILERLGLTMAEMNRNVLKLSGGQQQRVAIARAIASDAAIILADEPTGNLDDDTAAEITTLLKESAHQLQKCVVVVTHSNDVARQADAVLQIRHRKLLMKEVAQ
ncbi:ABC transporter ATP-binding protein [Anaerocolumna cellulosilytica]|uniref:ABC transporter ATP-binding protein n=1 Tax=Anaerocolumna cellulosilytica TaxID=433286 RepID=A0A6S6R4B1_9FIRM|nr:ATP-binding cassette domain-containing protein [Anaerocolumna cellulosilytica]MBB5193897.1 putative ABC transport system ATP-binding protein [Anaerocolumna cellulosilytica]BCJ94887.1 ABC transporter ATP-binding protein [Anaerocolumna cellulosilytica]